MTDISKNPALEDFSKDNKNILQLQHDLNSPILVLKNLLFEMKLIDKNEIGLKIGNAIESIECLRKNLSNGVYERKYFARQNIELVDYLYEWLDTYGFRNSINLLLSEENVKIWVWVDIKDFRHFLTEKLLKIIEDSQPSTLMLELSKKELPMLCRLGVLFGNSLNILLEIPVVYVGDGSGFRKLAEGGSFLSGELLYSLLVQLIEKLNLNKNGNEILIVITEDDPQMQKGFVRFLSWFISKYLNEQNSSVKFEFKILQSYEQTYSAWEKYFQSGIETGFLETEVSLDNCLFLCDHLIEGSSFSGLEAVDRMGISERSIMVSSLVGDQVFNQQMQRLRIKGVHKSVLF